MSRKIVLSFPGGRGPEIPLLYFGAKYFEDQGYEKVFVNHPVDGEKTFEALFANAEKTIERIAIEEYDEIVFIAKSIGTEVACKLKEKHNLAASLVLFTPTCEALPFIKSDNDILLVAAGENDRHLDTDTVVQLCEKESVNYYVEPNVGHRMEVMNDLERNLQIISNVLQNLKA